MKLGSISPSLWLAISATCSAAAIPYISTVSSYFIGDDFGFVDLLSRKPTFHFTTLFTMPWSETIYGQWYDELKPFVALSYQFNSLWGIASPQAYHLTNIVLHVINTLLVLVAARSIAGLSLPAATFSGLLFAIFPVQAEAVAWITGRVDSIPALFYLSSFIAYAAWRKLDKCWIYCLSLGLFFLALFSKQSAITMTATLALYDVLVMRNRRFYWQNLKAYIPYVFLTVAYLLLRFILFGNFVREDRGFIDKILLLGPIQQIHLEIFLLGSPISSQSSYLGPLGWAGIVLVFLAVALELRTPTCYGSLAPRGLVLYFGPVWWLVSILPLVVTYVAPRHLYLASAGIAITLGFAFEAARRIRGVPSVAAAFLGIALVLVCLFKLHLSVTDWNTAASASERIVRDTERQALDAPDGSLFILGAPYKGQSPETFTWLWSWAVPFALRPPFVETDLTDRLFFVEPPRVYCCSSSQWYAKTRNTISAWAERRDLPPAIALWWDASHGQMIRKSEAQDPQLRRQLVQLASTRNFREMCRGLGEILAQLGNQREECPTATDDFIFHFEEASVAR